MSSITKSAKDQQCQIRLPGICVFWNTVWCHGNGSAAGKGIGMKSPDYIGSYGCQPCHDVYDRRRSIPKDSTLTRTDVELAFADGVFRSQQILEKKGLLKVAA